MPHPRSEAPRDPAVATQENPGFPGPGITRASSNANEMMCKSTTLQHKPGLPNTTWQRKGSSSTRKGLSTSHTSITHSIYFKQQQKKLLKNPTKSYKQETSPIAQPAFSNPLSASACLQLNPLWCTCNKRRRRSPQIEPDKNSVKPKLRILPAPRARERMLRWVRFDELRRGMPRHPTDQEPASQVKRGVVIAGKSLKSKNLALSCPAEMGM